MEEYILSEEEFRKCYEQLNSLTGYPRWQETRAAKKHLDIFNTCINPSETYFQTPIGSGYGDNLKLSKISMDKLLYLIFMLHPVLNNIGENLMKQKQQEMHDEYMKVVDKLGLGGNLNLKCSKQVKK